MWATHPERLPEYVTFQAEFLLAEAATSLKERGKS
jgi:hypothetical protein